MTLEKSLRFLNKSDQKAGEKGCFFTCFFGDLTPFLTIKNVKNGAYRVFNECLEYGKKP